MKSLNKHQKQGLAVLLATGLAVGLGIGSKFVKSYVVEKHRSKQAAYRLQELENEQFEEDFE